MNEIISRKLDVVIGTMKTFHRISQPEINELQRGCSFLQETAPDRAEHALDTALHIAEYRFDYTVVLAAILHDFAAEDNNHQTLLILKTKFNNDTIRILHIFKEIHQVLIKDCNNRGMDTGLKQKIFYSEALFIQIAETISLMEHSTASEESQEQMLALANSAKNHLIPEIKNIRAYMLVDILENLCLKIERNELYRAIQKQLKKIDEQNGRYQNYFLIKLEQLFDKNCKIIPDGLRKRDQPYINQIIKNKRSVSSIARHLERRSSSLPYDFENLMDKKEMPYWDITLIVENDIKKSGLRPKDIFFDYFNHCLQDHIRIYVLGYYETTYKDSDYFLICDAMNNLYRIFIKTEDEYLCYKLGSRIDKSKFSLDYNPEGTNLIKIFKKDGTVSWIEEGATVLDFAFMLHGNLGLHFDYALINNNPQHRPAHTRLSNGDSVRIIKSSDCTAEFNWFRYVKTSHALDYLIKYFNSQKQSRKIKVRTKDGTTESIQNGATVLDLAFQIHTRLGLQFEYALINGKSRHQPAFTPLHNNDTVIIIAGDSITADLQWFKYLKTESAINKLIKYFQNSIDQFVWLTEK